MGGVNSKQDGCSEPRDQKQRMEDDSLQDKDREEEERYEIGVICITITSLKNPHIFLNCVSICFSCTLQPTNA